MSLLEELKYFWKQLWCEHDFQFGRIGKFWIFHRCTKCGKGKKIERPDSDR